MEVSVKKLPASRVEMTVTLPWEEWESEIDHAVKHLSEEVKIEGFRKGRIPRGVLERRIGREAILGETAEHVVDHTYPRAIKQSGVEPIGKPEAELGTIAEHEPFTYTVRTAVMPEVVLGAWEKPVAERNGKHRSEAVPVSDAEIDETLQRVADSRAVQTPVDRAASTGDVAVVDFFVTVDGVPVEGGSSRKHPIVIGSGAFIPGFEDELTGMRTGEEKTFTLPFPDAYHAKMLAGKRGEFRVTVLSVEERRPPAIDDDFARSLGAFADVAALRAQVKENLGLEKREKDKETHRTAILEAILEVAEADLPDVLVDGELDSMMREFSAQAGSVGMTLDDFLARTGKSEEALRTEWRPQAKKRVLSGIVLDRIAEDRGVSVEPAEIEAEINRALTHFKSVRQAEEQVDLPALYAAVRSRLRNEKTFDILERIGS